MATRSGDVDPGLLAVAAGARRGGRRGAQPTRSAALGPAGARGTADRRASRRRPAAASRPPGWRSTSITASAPRSARWRVAGRDRRPRLHRRRRRACTADPRRGDRRARPPRRRGRARHRGPRGRRDRTGGPLGARLIPACTQLPFRALSRSSRVEGRPMAERDGGYDPNGDGRLQDESWSSGAATPTAASPRATSSAARSVRSCRSRGTRTTRRRRSTRASSRWTRGSSTWRTSPTTSSTAPSAGPASCVARTRCSPATSTATAPGRWTS